jgi:hypothetical protein
MEKTPNKNSPNTAEIVDMLRAISSDLHTESHKLQQYERDLLQVQTELDRISRKIWLAYSTMNDVNKVIEELQAILESHPITQATSAPPPTPTGDVTSRPLGLVDRVLSQLPADTDPIFARQALHEMATWAHEQGLLRTNRKLREEANR